jgi:hypothetical protein
LRSPFPVEFLVFLAKCPVKLTYIGVSYYADTPVPKHSLRSGENGDSVTRYQNVLSKETWIFVRGKVRTGMFSSPILAMNRLCEFCNYQWCIFPIWVFWNANPSYPHCAIGTLKVMTTNDHAWGSRKPGTTRMSDRSELKFLLIMLTTVTA